MARVTCSEELRERLVQGSGEDVAACGWGTLGFTNVFAGVTATALLLETITVSYGTKEFRRIPWEELEFIHAVKGNAATPGILKINLQGAVTESITGTLLVKVAGEKLMYISFSKLPRYEKNDAAPIRIAEFISSIAPEKVRKPEQKEYREKQGLAGCLRGFIMISAVLSALLFTVMGIATGDWETALYAGVSGAVVLGAVFAPLIPMFRRMITGRG